MNPSFAHLRLVVLPGLTPIQESQLTVEVYLRGNQQQGSSLGTVSARAIFGRTTSMLLQRIRFLLTISISSKKNAN